MNKDWLDVIVRFRNYIIEIMSIKMIGSLTNEYTPSFRHLQGELRTISKKIYILQYLISNSWHKTVVLVFNLVLFHSYEKKVKIFIFNQKNTPLRNQEENVHNNLN
jgi:hypothetical protein